MEERQLRSIEYLAVTYTCRKIGVLRIVSVWCYLNASYISMTFSRRSATINSLDSVTKKAYRMNRKVR